MPTTLPITIQAFDAYLRCRTKFYLLDRQTVPLPSFFTDPSARINENYKSTAILQMRVLSDCKVINYEDIKIKELDGRTLTFVDCHHCCYSPSGLLSTSGEVNLLDRSGDDKFLPILFSTSTKLTMSDMLLLCFGALSLAQLTGVVPRAGRFCFGKDHRVKAIKITNYVDKTLAILDKIIQLRANGSAPPLVINKHCAVCDFHLQCRQAAIDCDDLSLISTLGEQERLKANAKGIFTIAQLSYGYRPRRRRGMRAETDTRRHNSSLKHDHKLKALAIKKGQIHVIGTPSTSADGTPLYIDIEGVPDRDFYYLIGLRYRQGDCIIEQSFWADTLDDERAMWAACLGELQTIDNPHLIHYGSYEAKFIKKMKTKYPDLMPDGHFADRLISSTTNLLSLIYAQIYFPTYSNSLKEIARYLGFRWTHQEATGSLALLWRLKWEFGRDAAIKERLAAYNLEDCRAAEIVAESLREICSGAGVSVGAKAAAINVSSLEVGYQRTFGKFAGAVPEFEKINRAAYWDYQRAKVYIRSSPQVRQSVKRNEKSRDVLELRVVREVYEEADRPPICPRCGSTKVRVAERFSRVIIDLRFMRHGVKRHVFRSNYNRFRCGSCRAETCLHPRRSKYGLNLRAYVIYLIIEMRMSNQKIAEHLLAIFGIRIDKTMINTIKSEAADEYSIIYDNLIKQIAKGSVVHADETSAVVRDGGHYVWIFANFITVVYVYSESRDGGVLKDTLEEFTGVLVSDFYAVYEAMDCSQQKCLIHLMRDINEELLRNPFNEQLVHVAGLFGRLLREIVETVDKHGLKARYLRKHKRAAESFMDHVKSMKCHSDVVSALRKRIEKNRDKLFTFLDHDDVPWNNNNAEHAVRAFTRLRNAMGTSTAKGTREYAILLSIQQTLKYRGINFLDFLRSNNMSRLITPGSQQKDAEPQDAAPA
jgi:predicted RecB family nuclease